MNEVKKLTPFVSEKVWGYEHWLVSTLKHGQSCYNGKNLSEVLQKDYPLLIKVIQANDKLSVQVHPNDEYAKKYENSYGKTECWYILEATEGAKLVSGLKEEYSREDLERAITKNTLDEKLFISTVKKGDFLFIPAGTVHAICGGLRILEVQQPSDVTYRIYDWGRLREMHVEKSLDVIVAAPKDCLQAKIIHNFNTRFSCDFFTLEVLFIENELKIDPSHTSDEVVFFVIDGEGVINTNSETFSLQKEDTFLIDQKESFVIKSQHMHIMKIYR
ncbi:MAG: type I phosphomannose isomerase catalytic subunit [Treponemataceae bacterium]